MVQIFVEILFSYQIFNLHAEGVGQSSDRANGNVLGLDLSSFDFADLPGIDARQLCKFGLGHALAGANG